MVYPVNGVYCKWCILSHWSTADEWFIGIYTLLQKNLQIVCFFIFTDICLPLKRKRKKKNYEYDRIKNIFFLPSFMLKPVLLFPRVFIHQLVGHLCNLEPGQLNTWSIHNLQLSQNLTSNQACKFRQYDFQFVHPPTPKKYINIQI